MLECYLRSNFAILLVFKTQKKGNLIFFEFSSVFSIGCHRCYKIYIRLTLAGFTLPPLLERVDKNSKIKNITKNIWFNLLRFDSCKYPNACQVAWLYRPPPQLNTWNFGHLWSLKQILKPSNIILVTTVKVGIKGMFQYPQLLVSYLTLSHWPTNLSIKGETEAL